MHCYCYSECHIFIATLSSYAQSFIFIAMLNVKIYIVMLSVVMLRVAFFTVRLIVKIFLLMLSTAMLNVSFLL
jgi:hypothetical protein